ncbi:abortive infection family protein [uncultured Jannaschia sp.]|uniref:abortive infection family protein n=1 Tax=uncultured Jannaschia sp. TaxID=293347 RepID=UPI00260CEBF4|nr:abortive infection family protein [uncultured Jannaschia sp.]
MASFSTFTIEALVQTISGGPGLGSTEPPIGVYRSASGIEGFLMACGIDPAHGEGSRLPALRGCLNWAARQENGDELIGRAIEKVADPRNHSREPEKTQAVLDHLNLHLAPDGFEVALLGGRAVLRKRGSGAAVVGAIAEKTATLDFGTVSRDLDRATRNAEDDPEDAVTAACATLEAVCRSILVELRLDLPAKKDVSALVRAVQEPLGLSPGRMDLPDLIVNDIRKVLSGLTTATEGIGALRTHGGDAHGRERGHRRIDPRIARLAIHAASTVALFLIETWERKMRRGLPAAAEPTE